MIKTLKTLLAYILTILDAVRYWDWYYVARVNLHALLVLFLFIEGSSNFVLEIIMYILYVHAVLAIGFLVNNLSDYKIDTAVGKSYLSTISKRTAKIIIFALLIYVIFFATFLDNLGISLTILASFFLGIGYSLRPIRFKERGFMGVLAPMVAQHASFLFFVFLLPSHANIILYIFFWLLLDGILIELEQQTRDYANDLQTRTKTFVTQIGKEQAKKIVYFFTILFIAFMIVPVLVMGLPGVLMSLLLMVFSSVSLSHAHRSIIQLSAH